LRVPLKLLGTDKLGNKIEQDTNTDDVSLSGFLCTCTTELPVDSIVEVYLTNSGTNYVGKAKVVHSDTKAAPLRHFGFRFIEKTGPWVLN
jgi:hypothetical protein